TKDDGGIRAEARGDPKDPLFSPGVGPDRIGDVIEGDPGAVLGVIVQDPGVVRFGPSCADQQLCCRLERVHAARPRAELVMVRGHVVILSLWSDMHTWRWRCGPCRFDVVLLGAVPGVSVGGDGEAVWGDD